MNIAFEISPFITASGTFGDKSGVYRYMFGLLKGMANYIKKNKLDIKIVLFSFNPHFLKIPINPDIYDLIDKKRVVLLRKDPPYHYKTGLLIKILKRILLTRPNIFIKIINKIFFIKYFLNLLTNQVEFKTYLSVLDEEFNKRKIKIIFHSETGFFKVGDYKNVVIMYDLTPINMSELHRMETKDLMKRKLSFSEVNSDGIICISKSTKDDLIKYSPLFKKKKIAVCYPGLDDSFKKEVLDKANKEANTKSINYVLKKYKTSVIYKNYFLYYGTFEPRKNILYIVKAFMDLQKEKQIPSDFKLILIGGEGWGMVKKKIKNYLLEEYPIDEQRSIILLDYINDKYLIKFIQSAYAIVYPSLYEGFGLPVLESMALGSPVITSNTSSLPEVGGHSVLYVNPWDFFDIKEKMRYLIKNKSFAKELSNDGLVQASKFTWEDSVSKIMRFIKAL